MSIDHYENFPVASWLCPPALRPAMVALYRYARTGDDIADEGTALPHARRVELQRYRQALVAVAAGVSQGREGAKGTAALPDIALPWRCVFEPLAVQLRERQLPLAPLLDLLDAFDQDIDNPEYPDRATLLDYCRRSANPVGRLVLHLHGVRDQHSLAQSDAICTALQLINFWQDMSIDHPRGRCYVPMADAQAHGLSRSALMGGVDTERSQALMADLCSWARALMLEGADLALRLPGRVGWELRLVVQGGLRILHHIAQLEHRCLSTRPRIRFSDGIPMLWGAARMTSSPNDRGIGQS